MAFYLDSALVEEAEIARQLGWVRGVTTNPIPATPPGFQALARLSPEITCAVTAIFSPAQAAVAQVAGARYAIVYVNRSTRLIGDGPGLVQWVFFVTIQGWAGLEDALI